MSRRLFSHPMTSPIIACTMCVACAFIPVSLVGVHAVGPSPRSTSPAPNLVLHRHGTRIHAAFADHTRLIASFYPTLPGRNSVRLVYRGAGGHAVTVSLVAVMPGMTMAPSHAVLARRGSSFAGRIILPMFGRYLVQVRAASANGIRHVTFQLALPLPRI